MLGNEEKHMKLLYLNGNLLGPSTSQKSFVLLNDKLDQTGMKDKTELNSHRDKL